MIDECSLTNMKEKKRENRFSDINIPLMQSVEQYWSIHGIAAINLFFSFG